MAEKKLPKGVKLRKDGRYEGRFMYHGENYTVYGDDARKVKKQLDDLRYEVEHNIYQKPSKTTVNKWFDEWIEVYKEPSLKRSTICNYKRTYDIIRKTIGNKYMADVRAKDIQRVYNNMAQEGYTDARIKLARAIMSGMFKQAYRDKMITENPVALIAGLPKGKSSSPGIALTKDEQYLFMEYAEKYSPRFYRFFYVALCTGMRNGELRGLRWSDVDFKKRVIHVTGTLEHITSETPRRTSPKSKTSFRDVPMIDKVCELLKAEKVFQAKTRLKRGAEWKPLDGLEDLVFTSENGKPWDWSNISQIKGRIIKRIREDGKEIRDFTVHSLRHTFATRAIENGMNPQTLKAILGHSTLAITMDLYGHVLEDTKTAEMQLISKAF